jgi:hypothetical protein
MSAPSVLRSVTATTSYVALEAVPATHVSILNKTGATLLIEHAGDSGTGKEITLADGLSVGLATARSASEIRIKSASGTTGVYVVINYQP